MKLFYGSISAEGVEIHPDEQQHILKVLRLKAGDRISVTDGKGNLASGSLVLEGKKALLQQVQLRQNLPDFSPRLHLAIAPTKNIDRTEFFVEKATEMGVAEITFVLTEKSERRILNLEKIEKQMIAASKQSLRTHFPVINGLTKLSDFIKKHRDSQIFVAHCDAAFERMELSGIEGENLTFLIGPEGDFSPREITLLAKHGIKAVSLGSQRLRTETAGVYLAAWNYSRM